MAYLGYPIIGDNIYSNGKNNYGIIGQVLQSKYLEFNHPITNKKMVFEEKDYEEIVRIEREEKIYSSIGTPLEEKIICEIFRKTAKK